MNARSSLMNRFSILLFACAMALTFMTPAAAAPALTFKFTAVNIPGSSQVNAFGISEAGVIVGEYIGSDGLPHGYTLKGKTVTTVNDPKGLGTFCQGISPNGSAIVGYYITSTGKNLGFLLKGKTFTDVPGPKGATVTFVFGVNDSTEIVGMYEDKTFKKHGFLLKNGKYKTLDVPGTNGVTTVTGINNSGDIVMYWDNKGPIESALYNGKTYKIINVPGSSNSFAQGINNHGDIVYWFADSKGIHGALQQGVTFSHFDDPKGVGETYGFGLNDNKQIVGSWGKSTFQGYQATY